jgi:predicted enzyme related to lactoylglutathione lyase
MKNAIDWFEIPAKNLTRAKKFYSTVLGVEIQDWANPTGGTDMQYAVFPFDMQNGGVGGVLVQGKGYEPSEKGSVVILNAGDDLSKPLAKVEKAGGKIVVPKFAIGQFGFLAYIIDSEGNKVAFHSLN